ncbi:TetR/AcrR family transcriptional regulator [Salinispira pacifica]|nr:TetR/AcrR family transcriptional regulator [Salinispira pacifica]
MYVAKEPEERRTEFLNSAMTLFMQQGYDQTSVNAIIDAVGVSKGAFYHYFKSKEELLDQLAERAAEQSLGGAQAILDDPEMSAVEKLNALFAQTNQFKAQNRDLMIAIAQVFYSDGNILLRSRLSERSVERVAPILAQILEQGRQEGSMDVVHPEETARFVLRIGTEVVQTFASGLGSGESGPGGSGSGESGHGLLSPEAREQINVAMEVYERSVERILGLSDGSLTLIDDSIIELITGEKHD